jgi:hypothetical protein
MANPFELRQALYEEHLGEVDSVFEDAYAFTGSEAPNRCRSVRSGSRLDFVMRSCHSRAPRQERRRLGA